MKKVHLTSRSLLLISLAALYVGYPALGQAADKEREVKANDTLGHIVAEEYPDYGNKPAIMQAILKASPDAFIGGNLNRLVVGKNLKLPDAASIPGLKPAPPVAEGGDPALLAKLKELETGRAELEENLKVLEDENASLQDMVKSYEEAKQAKDAELTKLEARVKELEGMLAASGKTPDSAASGGEAAGEAPDLAALKANVTSLQTENADLKGQLDKAKQSLQENQRETEGLKTQLADIKRLNDQLNTDLQARTAEAKASSNWLPWTLLGLMAALMLPLLWLLKRHRDEPVVTTVAAPPKPAPVVALPVPAKPAEQQAYSDTTPPPMPVMPEVEEVVDTGPEDPDAELKLDIARAYLDLRDSEAAAEILQEVLAEGGNRQKREAREILSFIA
jgi:FimV-like protein